MRHTSSYLIFMDLSYTNTSTIQTSINWFSVLIQTDMYTCTLKSIADMALSKYFQPMAMNEQLRLPIAREIEREREREREKAWDMYLASHVEIDHYLLLT